MKLVHFAQKILTIREIFVQTAENPENQKIFLKRVDFSPCIWYNVYSEREISPHKIKTRW